MTRRFTKKQQWMFVVLSIGTVFCLLVIVVGASFYYFNPHPSDRVLIGTFRAHQQDFETLATMANEDQKVRWLRSDFVMFDDYRFWPKDGENEFSWQRWNEYDAVFKRLGPATKHEFDKETGLVTIVMIPASVNTTEPDENYEYRVSVKGYAYSRAPISSTLDSLDWMGVDNLGRTYRRIDAHWYLYHDCGIGKPE